MLLLMDRFVRWDIRHLEFLLTTEYGIGMSDIVVKHIHYHTRLPFFCYVPLSVTACNVRV